MSVSKYTSISNATTELDRRGEISSTGKVADSKDLQFPSKHQLVDINRRVANVENLFTELVRITNRTVNSHGDIPSNDDTATLYGAEMDKEWTCHYLGKRLENDAAFTLPTLPNILIHVVTLDGRSAIFSSHNLLGKYINDRHTDKPYKNCIKVALETLFPNGGARSVDKYELEVIFDTRKPYQWMRFGRNLLRVVLENDAKALRLV